MGGGGGVTFDMVPYMNAVSREVIVKRIMKVAGEEYSFDSFVAKDKYEPDPTLSWWIRGVHY
jgi:hypothetical protein